MGVAVGGKHHKDAVANAACEADHMGGARGQVAPGCYRCDNREQARFTIIMDGIVDVGVVGEIREVLGIKTILGPEDEVLPALFAERVLYRPIVGEVSEVLTVTVDGRRCNVRVVVRDGGV